MEPGWQRLLTDQGPSDVGGQCRFAVAGRELTVAVMEGRGFGHDDYRLFHPSGAIGTKLTLRVIG